IILIREGVNCVPFKAKCSPCPKYISFYPISTGRLVEQDHSIQFQVFLRDPALGIV
ncbi:hypothetical protein Nepgr_033284, partial [Nepenthes gracilis]